MPSYSVVHCDISWKNIFEDSHHNLTKKRDFGMSAAAVTLVLDKTITVIPLRTTEAFLHVKIPGGLTSLDM